MFPFCQFVAFTWFAFRTNSGHVGLNQELPLKKESFYITWSCSRRVTFLSIIFKQSMPLRKPFGYTPNVEYVHHKSYCFGYLETSLNLLSFWAFESYKYHCCWRLILPFYLTFFEITRSWFHKKRWMFCKRARFENMNVNLFTTLIRMAFMIDTTWSKEGSLLHPPLLPFLLQSHHPPPPVRTRHSRSRVTLHKSRVLTPRLQFLLWWLTIIILILLERMLHMPSTTVSTIKTSLFFKLNGRGNWTWRFEIWALAWNLRETSSLPCHVKCRVNQILLLNESSTYRLVHSRHQWRQWCGLVCFLQNQLNQQWVDMDSLEKVCHDLQVSENGHRKASLVESEWISRSSIFTVFSVNRISITLRSSSCS